MNLSAKILNYLLKGIYGKRGEKESHFLAEKSVYSFAVLAASLGFNFIINLLFTRFLGAEIYGLFSYITTTILVIVVFALLGTDTFLVRELAFDEHKSTKHLLQWGQSRLTITVILSIVIFALILFFVHSYLELPLVPTLTGLLLIPVIAFLRYYTAVLQGKKMVIAAQVPEKIIRPVVFLALLLIYFLIPVEKNLYESVLSVIVLNILAFAIALGYAFSRFNPVVRTLPNDREEEIVADTKRWEKSSMTLFWISGIIILNGRTDILMLGALTNAESVGVYTIAYRLSEIIAFSLLVINFPLSPLISNLFVRKEIQKLQSVIKRGVRLAFLMAMPLFLLFVFFSEKVLSVFGETFTGGSNTLIILCVAQLVNVLIGSVNKILTMAGFEKEAFRSLVLSVLVNITLNLYLIPEMGIDGAAYATATSMVLWNLMMLYYVIKRVGVNPTIFSLKWSK